MSNSKDPEEVSLAGRPEEWQSVSPAEPELFGWLRSLGEAEIHIRFGIGTAGGHRVEVPAASLTVRGRLTVEPEVDRIAVQVTGWSATDFAWFSRRKGRGRTDYWQGAIEYRPAGAPELVLYFTAPLDGLELRVRQLPTA